MKFVLYIFVFVTLNVNAQNLAQILESLNSSNKTKAILEKSKSQIAQNELSATYEAPSLGLSLSELDDRSSGGKDGAEYSVGISQDISHPFSSYSKNKSVKEYSKALKQETKHELHLLTLNVVSKYHNLCITKEMRDTATLLYDEQSNRFKQVKRAYQLGEISKKDLLFNKLDLAKLSKNINNYKRAYLSEFSLLQESVDNLIIDDVDCSDIKNPTRHVELRPLSEHGELKAIEYKKNATKALYDMHNSSISSLSYELLYEKEIDANRYTLGLSIPLSPLSSQNEKLRAEQFSLNASYDYEKTNKQAQIQNASKSLISKIEVIYDEFILLQSEIVPLNEELVKLSKSALDEGEGNIMEYLDATRSYSLNLIEMLETKKAYYNELHELYKTADLEIGENHENIN